MGWGGEGLPHHSRLSGDPTHQTHRCVCRAQWAATNTMAEVTKGTRSDLAFGGILV